MKSIKCLETGKIYASVTECSFYTDISQSSLSQTLTGKTKTAGGLHFEYCEESSQIVKLSEAKISNGMRSIKTLRVGFGNLEQGIILHMRMTPTGLLEVVRDTDKKEYYGMIVEATPLEEGE